MYRRNKILLMFSFISLLFILEVSSLAQPNIAPVLDSNKKLVYHILVSENGNSTINILFNDTARGFFSIYLPKFQRPEMSVEEGKIVFIESNVTNYYFYNLTKIAYIPGDKGIFSLRISYKFPYAALMIGDKAHFISPLIGASNDVNVIVKVYLPKFRRIERAEPVSYSVKRGVVTFYLKETATGTRVTLVYTLTEKVEEIVMEKRINDTVISAKAPLYYRRFTSKVIDTFEKAAPYFKHIFGELARNVEFKFFLPEEAGALGYVIGETVNVKGEGPIYLNILLIRFAPGYLETTVIHEYVHIALGKIGVKARPNTGELIWFHEAMAQYISLKVSELIGADVSLIVEDLEKALKELNPPFFFLKDWCNAGKGAIGECYAAAYYVISYIADKRGGLEFVRKLVETIKRRGGIESDEDVIKAFNEAAGEDLSNVFKRLGIYPSLPFKTYKALPYLTIIVLGLLLTVTFYIIFKSRLELSIIKFTLI